MHRLFVAIRPPRAIRVQLLGLMGGVSGVRWQADEQLHITLRFIGAVEHHVANDIAAALGAIRHSAFEARLDGIGTFGKRGQSTALWAGVTPAEPLKALHKKIDQACVRAGIVPEQRAYQPHITLARLKRSSGSVEAIVQAAGSLSSDLFFVDSFGLFESNLTPEGAFYTMAARYTLD